MTYSPPDPIEFESFQSSSLDKQITIRITPSDKLRLKQFAKEKGVSMGIVVRWAMKTYFGNN